MKKLSHTLAGYVVSRSPKKDISYEIYQYGFQIFLEVILNTIFSLTISISMGMFFECIIFYIVFIPLRAYTGGFHLKNYSTCFVASSLILVGVIVIAKYITFPMINCIVLLILLGIVVKCLASFKNRNRGFEEEDIQYFENKVKYILIAVALLTVVFSVLRQEQLVFQITLTLLLIAATMIIDYIMIKRTLKQSNC